jgi:hypothetical protein
MRQTLEDRDQLELGDKDGRDSRSCFLLLQKPDNSSDAIIQIIAGICKDGQGKDVCKITREPV